MLTNNYIQLEKLRFLSAKNKYYTATFVRTTGNSFTSIHPDYVTAGLGGVIAFGKAGWIYEEKLTSTSDNHTGVFFGSGSTAAERSDYKLETPITSGLTVANSSSVVEENDGNGKYTFLADYRVSNTSDAEISISEIGAFCPCGKGSSEYYPIMLERTVLDEPIVIQPGKSKKITYAIVIDQILNS